MTTTRNRQRARRISEMLRDYSGTDEYCNLMDLLTDSLHFARMQGYDLQKLFHTVTMHFTAETQAVLPPWPLLVALPEEVAHALARLVMYLWRDELADFAETSPLEGRDTHIFLAVRLVRRWLRCQQIAASKCCFLLLQAEESC